MDIVLRADSLTAIMLGMVTFVSTLVVIYASGYMHGDPGYWRFFAYVALFVFSMTMLVSVSNFVLLYVFWEAVGLCSYLLIGFWFEKPAAAAAGMKAFLVNRVGDFGFALGVFLLWTTFGTLDFHDSKVQTIPAASGHVAATIVYIDPQEIEDPNIPGTVERGIFGHWRLTKEHPFGEGRRDHGHLPAVVRGCLRQERPVPAARLAAGCDGRPYAGQRLDPRGDDGHRRRLPGRPLHAALRGVARRPGSGCHDRRLHGPAGRADRPDANRFEADPGLLDRQPARIHVPGPGHGQPARRDRRHVPPVHARLFQGPVVPRRRQRDARHGRGDRHPPVRRPAAANCRRPIGPSSSAAWPSPAIIPFAGFWSKDAILAAVAEKGARGPLGSFYAYLYYAGTITAFLTAFYTFRAYFLTFHGEERIPKEAGHQLPTSRRRP